MAPLYVEQGMSIASLPYEQSIYQDSEYIAVTQLANWFDLDRTTCLKLVKSLGGILTQGTMKHTQLSMYAYPVREIPKFLYHYIQRGLDQHASKKHKSFSLTFRHNTLEELESGFKVQTPTGKILRFIPASENNPLIFVVDNAS